MNKKTYNAPISTVVVLSQSNILAGTTGATVPDAGWDGAKKTVFDGNTEINNVE